MSDFIFKNYSYSNGLASFSYAYEDNEYTERVEFSPGEDHDSELLDRALFLAFLVVGTSYYKAFPARTVRFEAGGLDTWQAEFCNKVFQEGLSQYAFENSLTRDDLAYFVPTLDNQKPSVTSKNEGILSMQSGGKDSLLVAALLAEKQVPFTPFYITNNESYPQVLNSLGEELVVAKRSIDLAALRGSADRGGKNGHVPVTYIVQALALVQAILLGKNTVLAAIAHEGEEPHEWIGDLPVNHQWSKTWQAEQLFSEYVRRYVSPDLRVGSPLRGFSELKVTELFARFAWERFGSQFSSCNEANYRQGMNNTELTWCGHCPKCANSYLLFSPFIKPEVLQERLGGELYQKLELIETFKGLLGIDGIMKPFECVGEIDELRAAYDASQITGYAPLPFDVPQSDFDKDIRYLSQDWTSGTIDL